MEIANLTGLSQLIRYFRVFAIPELPKIAKKDKSTALKIMRYLFILSNNTLDKSLPAVLMNEVNKDS